MYSFAEITRKFRQTNFIPDFNIHPVFKFISRRSGPFNGSVTLTRDRVYIVPTKAGLIFSLLLLTLLVGSINYEKNLGFILTFLLVGLGNIFLLSTWRNIAGLTLKSNNSPPVFSGEEASFNVQLINQNLFERYSIAISQQGVEHDLVNCEANNSRLIQFNVRSTKRGLLNAGRFRLYTEFPSGLFIAWTWVDLSMTCMVYPSPENNITLPVFAFNENGGHDSTGSGQENFSHLRKYQQGDNISRISWKASAKTEQLLSKEFIGSKPVNHWVTWDSIPARDTEHRLSIMTALIIHAKENQQCYGLKLPGNQIQPNSGNEHFHKCLRTLALF